ncbi:carbohydrate ABC transporter permease [Paenibacillus antri]|uniref:Carbohydrate ABC transporter permease n=1 Tax=Paenibacillus antri TaxID=2582848 RepID=A0A5R9GFC7_9BACL|nr:carbohydrate ABC transporter permease [Paenibacillus antri]TLS53879.1 carbohydrate ABC transporter permease [Paenibacillus antri]
MSTRSRWATCLFLFFFVSLSIIVLYPLVGLLLASFKPATELLRNGLSLKLQTELFTLNNYSYLFSDAGRKYFFWYRNSLVITSLFTLLSLLLSAMVGYGLAIYQFKGKNILFVLVLVVMMIPVEIIILPLYKLTISLQLINNYWGVILPFVVAPLPIFFFRQFASSLPKDYLDAGRVDGCTELGIFFRLMMPLMLPAFGAMAILQALHSWNNFLWPLIVLRTDDMLTLPIGLASMITPYGNNYDMLLSGAVLSIVPIVVLFAAFQRFFISGLTAGGVKG